MKEKLKEKFDHLELMINNLIPEWSVLKGLETNPIVKSAFIWFIIVPVCARIFGSLNDTLTFTYDEYEYVINLSLPFSWQIFFYSACAYAAGSLVVKLCCPSIIVDHNEYSSFQKSGQSWPQINGYLISLYYKNSKCEFQKKHRASLDAYLKFFHDWTAPTYKDKDKDKDIYINYDQDTLLFLQRVQAGENENQAFWYVYGSSNSYFLRGRIIASLLYMVGFILFFIVVIQNVLFVNKITSFFYS